MRVIIIGSLLLMLLAGCNLNSRNNQQGGLINFIHDIEPFTNDSLVRVVVEIPAGTNQKWEVNKQTGIIEWEEISADSFRVVNYLPYPANYGFVPQTLLPKDKGGDGDPVDVFILGSSIPGSSVCKVSIVGIIYMRDDGLQDSKLLAVSVDDELFKDVSSYDMLSEKYVGVVDIIEIWLSNYKGDNTMKIDSLGNEKEAYTFLKASHREYNENKN